MLDKINEIQQQLDELKSSIKTNVCVVLDRSGSMQSNKEDHEGGLLAFIEEQKKLPNATFTFIQFDDTNPFELIYDGVPLNEVTKIQLKPRGLTPLYDAIGRTINHLTNKNQNTDTVLMIVTDGLENASREFSLSTIKTLINDKKALGWQVLFVGTNFDVLGVGSNLGIDNAKNVSYNNTKASIDCYYNKMSNKMSNFRSSRASGQSMGVSADCLNFDEQDIEEIKAE